MTIIKTQQHYFSIEGSDKNYFDWGICSRDNNLNPIYIRLSDMLSQWNAPIPQAVQDLMANGCRYANHDFDVLANFHSMIPNAKATA